MSTAWFALLGFLLIAYAVLDGIDLGVGILHPVVNKDDGERRTALNAIGPFWFGYEVWLIVAGGSMVAAFPRLYAASFSGFYLVLIIVLWLLIARGSSIEFRSHVADPLWRGFWDFVFCASSLLLAVFFGAAVGNVVRGVPLDATGSFQASFAIALNPFAILVGVLSVALLAMHGANFLAFKAVGAQHDRAKLWGRRLWVAVAVMTAAATVAAFLVRPGLGAKFLRYPFLLVLPVLVVAALVAVRWLQGKGDDENAIRAGAVFLGSLMASAGASLYPALLPALGRPDRDLTIFNASAPRYNQELALIANLVTIAVVLGYFTLIHRVFRGTVKVGPGEHGY